MGLLDNYSADLTAINNYFRQTPIKPMADGSTNVEAFQIKDSFTRWYDALSWGQQNFTGQDTYDEARTRRNQFNLALAQTAAAKDNIRQQLATGVETEEMKGGTRPEVDTATGRVGTQVKKPTVAPTPSAMPNSATPQPAGAVQRQTLRIGSRGPDVDVWQTFVGISPTTGVYGTTTEGKTKTWQINWNKNHPADKIGTDGVVGPQTWARAFPATTPNMPSAFAPTPVPIGPGGTPKKATASASSTGPAAAKTAQAAAGAKQAAAKTGQKIAQAGMLNIGKWPLWVKVGAGISVVGGIAAAFMGQHKNPPRYGYRRE